jgi:hypothetical protein
MAGRKVRGPAQDARECNVMLIDHRTYTCRPGAVPLQLELYKTYGFPAQTRHLGMPLAFMTAETGDLNTYVHMWVFRDAADREKRRAAMMADPEWREFLARSRDAGYVISMKNALMAPVPFSPVGAE